MSSLGMPSPFKFVNRGFAWGVGAGRTQECMYRELGVSKDADQGEIKKAYYALAKKYHPDMVTNPTAKAQAQEKFAKLGAAFDTLGNESKRRIYDLDQRRGHQGGGYQSQYSSSYADSQFRDKNAEYYTDFGYSYQESSDRRYSNLFNRFFQYGISALFVTVLAMEVGTWIYRNSSSDVKYVDAWFNLATGRYEPPTVEIRKKAPFLISQQKESVVHPMTHVDPVTGTMSRPLSGEEVGRLAARSRGNVINVNTGKVVKEAVQ